MKRLLVAGLPNGRSGFFGELISVGRPSKKTFCETQWSPNPNEFDHFSPTSKTNPAGEISFMIHYLRRGVVLWRPNLGTWYPFTATVGDGRKFMCNSFAQSFIQIVLQQYKLEKKHALPNISSSNLFPPSYRCSVCPKMISPSVAWPHPFGFSERRDNVEHYDLAMHHHYDDLWKLKMHPFIENILVRDTIMWSFQGSSVCVRVCLLSSNVKCMGKPLCFTNLHLSGVPYQNNYLVTIYVARQSDNTIIRHPAAWSLKFW